MFNLSFHYIFDESVRLYAYFNRCWGNNMTVERFERFKMTNFSIQFADILLEIFLKTENDIFGNFPFSPFATI